MILPHEEYQDTVNKLEPDIHMIDAGAFFASAAISLKRIADSLEIITKAIEEVRNNEISRV